MTYQHHQAVEQARKRLPHNQTHKMLELGQLPRDRAEKYGPKWDDRYYLLLYKFVKAGYGIDKIAKMLGVQGATINNWRRKNPVLREIMEEARVESEDTFKDYIYKRLSPHLKEVWNEIHRYDKETDAVGKLEALFEREGKLTRQRLFLHALCIHNFNRSKACRLVGISKKTLDNWVYEDEDFADLVSEMDWHKGNFFEEALYKLVKKGSEAAVLFANRTYNKNRGYSEKLEVVGQVNHQHSVFVLDNLDLPLDVKKQILEAYEKQQAIDVESRPALPEPEEEVDPEAERQAIIGQARKQYLDELKYATRKKKKRLTKQRRAEQAVSSGDD